MDIRLFQDVEGLTEAMPHRHGSCPIAEISLS
jgi:hypothetical protein